VSTVDHEVERGIKGGEYSWPRSREVD